MAAALQNVTGDLMWITNEPWQEEAMSERGVEEPERSSSLGLSY